ncbi:MAG: Rne/Rng family ribonuclease [Sphingomonadales bacterium]
MSMRMLIDAAHREETRVAVVRGSQIEEFDLEAANKRQLKGNIYLAKVTRVEPSLQAAFVDFGGNRHGFLPFSEIHPDYYRIPTEDREALLQQQAQAEDEAREVEEKEQEAASPGGGDANDNDSGEPQQVESLGAEDEIDQVIQSNKRLDRHYNIQDVISKRQIILVQVVKEERGTKGAALTTYLSLAGRYCVLMPNSPRGGGVSRKISNPGDRKKLKSVLASFDLQPGMGAIIRTAGMKRTKTEIKRDLNALMRQWEAICDLTLHSNAPSVIHEEGNLIKRAIRDLYVREIEEVLVEGEEGYRTAKDFMRLLMPSHAKKVKQYKDRIPLFPRYQIEVQLDSMYSPTIQLKSGGYIVINMTEALVAIDVNSGRSTREASIERTALKTNLEAADEISRQLRLRDLAGLVVIDFIDMEENKHNRQVERRLKERLKTDRARLQVGPISHFGLLEMSRQRRRRGLLEASTILCPSCEGAGRLRSTGSATLQILRAVEEEGVRQRCSKLTIRTATQVANYLLNEKRQELRGIEDRYGLMVHIAGDSCLFAGQFEIDREGAAPATQLAPATEKTESEPAEAAPETEEPRAHKDEEREGKRRRRRSRRGRGRGTDGIASSDAEAVKAGEAADAADAADAAKPVSGGEDGGEPEKPARPKRRRGRRGGRRRRAAAETKATPLDSTTTEQPVEEATQTPAVTPTAESGTVDATMATTTVADAVAGEVPETESKPEKKPVRRRRKRAAPAKAEAGPETGPGSEAPAEASVQTAETGSEAKDQATEEGQAAEKPKPKRATRKRVTKKAAAKAEDQPSDETAPEPAPKPKRTRRRSPKPAPAQAETAGPEAPALEAPSASEKPIVVVQPPAGEPESGADQSPAAEKPARPAPKRRGWWQSPSR